MRKKEKQILLRFIKYGKTLISKVFNLLLLPYPLESRQCLLAAQGKAFKVLLLVT